MMNSTQQLEDHQERILFLFTPLTKAISTFITLDEGCATSRVCVDNSVW
jgi:hypothetical protein